MTTVNRPRRAAAAWALALLALPILAMAPAASGHAVPALLVHPAVSPAVVAFDAGSNTLSAGAGCVSRSLAPCADLTSVTSGDAIVVLLSSTNHGAVGPCADPANIADTSGDSYAFQSDTLNGTGTLASTLLYVGAFIDANAKAGDHTISWNVPSACSASADTFVGAWEISGGTSVSNLSAYRDEVSNSTFHETKFAPAGTLILFYSNAVRPNAGCDASGTTVGGGLGTNDGQSGSSSTRSTYMHGDTAVSPGVNTANCAMPVAQNGLSFMTVVGNYVAPSASFTEQPATGSQNGTSYFNATVMGGAGPFAYAWDFGDGGASTTGPDATHVYVVAGTFTVRLVVTDSVLSQAFSNASYTVTPSHPLTVIVRADPTPPVFVNATVAYEAVTYGGTAPYNWSWDFGNGDTAFGQFANETYPAVGNFTVSLTVVDGNGTTNLQDNLTVEVTTVPPPPPFVLNVPGLLLVALVVVGSIGLLVVAGLVMGRRGRDD